MSTDKTNKNNVSAKRIALLARTNEVIFHAKDLAVLWQIPNANTLYTTLKRYCQSQVLFRIYKGLYSLSDPQKLEPMLLGLKVLHQYAYVSTETVLFNEGIIFQPPAYVTLISAQSLQFTVGQNHYRSRQLAERFLFQDAGILSKNNIKIASVERAIADLLYFNPVAYLDNKKINWRQVQSLQKKLGYS